MTENKGNVVEKNLGVSTGGWKDAARRIIEAVIHDAAIDIITVGPVPISDHGAVAGPGRKVWE